MLTAQLGHQRRNRCGMLAGIPGIGDRRSISRMS